MTTSRFLCAAVSVAVVACSAAALAVAEAEPDASEMMEEPAAAEPDAPAPPAEMRPAAEVGRVARSAFTTAMDGREPTDTITTLGNDVDRVVYFTELRGLEGRTVVHRWMYGGEVMAEVPFEVRGPRWRVYSSKNLDSSWTGEWTVSVVADGEVLTSDGFTYTQAAPAAGAPGASEGAGDAPMEPAPAAPADPAAAE